MTDDELRTLERIEADNCRAECANPCDLYDLANGALAALDELARLGHLAAAIKGATS